MAIFLTPILSLFLLLPQTHPQEGPVGGGAPMLPEAAKVADKFFHSGAPLVNFKGGEVRIAGTHYEAEMVPGLVTCRASAGQVQLVTPSSGGIVEILSPHAWRVGTATGWETYKALSSGLKQGWTIAANPNPGMDHRISLSVTSPMEARQVAPGIIEWFDAEGVKIVYRDPEAFDANGNRVEISMQLEGKSIVLTISAVAMSAADYPVTIDPFLGAPFDIQNPSENFFLQKSLTSVTYVDSQDKFFVAYYDQETTDDWRIRLAIVNPDGTLSQSPQTLFDASVGDLVHSVGASYSPDLDKVLVVWNHTTSSNSLIAGILISSDGTPDPAALKIGPSTAPEWNRNPVVTHEENGVWLLAWEQILENDFAGNPSNVKLQMRRVDGSGVLGSAPSDIFTASSSTEMNERPSLATLPGIGSMMAYSQAIDNATPAEVLVRPIPFGGGAGSALTISQTGQDATRPCILAGTMAGEYLVSYQLKEGTLSSNGTLLETTGSIYTATVSSSGTILQPATLLASGYNTMPQGAYVPSVNQYLLVYSEFIDTTNVDYDIKVVRIDAANLQSLESVSLDFGSALDLYPSAFVHPQTGIALVVNGSYDSTAVIHGSLFEMPDDGTGSGSVNPGPGGGTGSGTAGPATDQDDSKENGLFGKLCFANAAEARFNHSMLFLLAAILLAGGLIRRRM